MFKKSKKECLIYKSSNKRRNRTNNIVTHKQRSNRTQDIPAKLFKTFNNLFNEPLTELLIFFLMKEYFPMFLKTAQVLPTFSKKPTKLICKKLYVIMNVSIPISLGLDLITQKLRAYWNHWTNLKSIKQRSLWSPNRSIWKFLSNISNRFHIK